jgi:hypothetical protein
MIMLGNKELLNGKLAVILNSSQSKTPCGSDLWITRTKSAVEELIGSGYTIITSLELMTWELAVYLTSLNKGRQIIISPVFDNLDGNSIFQKTIADFDLDESQTAMVFVKPQEKSQSPKDNWPRRDQAAVTLAQRIFPISIRNNGRLQKLLAVDVDSKKIDNKFKIEHAKSMISPPRYDIKLARNEFCDWDYITHWTRTCYGPWPGEKRAEFYQRLLNSKNEYPNNAFNTLSNIIKEQKIQASSHKIREGWSVIGFTEASPPDVLKLLRWCPKRVNWSFEPYGIAISKRAAGRLGIRPVLYGTDQTYEKLPQSEKPYFQNKGKSDVDWSREQECRHLGDLDLHLIAPDEIAYLVWNQDEACRIKSITGGPVFSFC